MSRALPPTAALSDALSDQIAGRKVISAVFTTYTFDPGFFELHVLPLLFPQQSFSHIDKVRRIQLDEAMRDVHCIAVYYDSSALAREATSATLDFERIDVRRRNGVFHPKLVLVLVENAPDEDDEYATQSLIVGTLSANLTRSGWWESVEAGHFEEIADKDVSTARCTYRSDLIYLCSRLGDNARSDESNEALSAIRAFIRDRADRRKVVKAAVGGRYYTRLFGGQASLSDWLDEQLGLARYDWNLEVISPFIDEGKQSALDDLVESTRPREVRVFLPEEPDGTPRGITEATYEAVEKLGTWSRLPDAITRRPGGGKSDKVAPRGVHAKVYRFWSKANGEVIVVGSVNLTRAGHSHARAGNLEAAFVVQTADPGAPLRWWLIPLNAKPTRFAERSDKESDEQEDSPLHVTLRFDWHTGRLSYRLEEEAAGTVRVCEPSGPELFVLGGSTGGDWVDCTPEASDRVRELLASTSFLVLHHPKGQWRVLVREEHIAFRPPLLSKLTPEEILLYWSLLSPAQKEAFIQQKLEAEAQLEGMSVTNAREQYLAENSMFDRFAGIFHAFACLRRHVEEALDDDRPREAEARLFGERYDSLPALLSRIDEEEEPDPVVAYVTYLCARQLRDRIYRNHRTDFWKERRDLAQGLEAQLAKLPAMRDPLGLPEEDAERFLNWFERVFTTEMTPRKDEDA